MRNKKRVSTSLISLLTIVREKKTRHIFVILYLLDEITTNFLRIILSRLTAFCLLYTDDPEIHMNNCAFILYIFITILLFYVRRRRWF